MIAERARESGLLVFAGAGVSMVAPSSLPNWYQFNEAVLGALADEVKAYSKPQLGEWIFSDLIERRNKTTQFAPDYMADVIAEEVGMDYFTVVQALDAPDTNACHETVASLAKAGFVRAVVTTNFDRLFERAFDRAGVMYRVFASSAEFTALQELLSSDTDTGPLIVKVHGTVTDPDSMVDTMSQRLVGRPAALEAALATLYAKHHVLFLGFSGADLDYDPEYLGLRAAAKQNKGFTYLARDKARASVEDLRAAWGDDAIVVPGALPEWVQRLAAELGVNTDGTPPSATPPVDRLAEVKKRAGEWASTLGRLQNVNILSSLLRAGDGDAAAGRLFWGVWKHYRRPEDCEGPTYARFNQLAGRYLLEYGFNIGSLRPPTSVRMIIGEDPIDKDQIDNAFQYLARSVHMGWSKAYTDLAVCQALLGKCKTSVEMISKALGAAIEHQHPILLIDTAIAGGLVWSMAAAWSQGLEYLELALKLAVKLGMEPRRARLYAHLVRFHAWKGRLDEAGKCHGEGVRIAERLGMESTRWELETAWGYALVEQKQFAEAVRILSGACDYFGRTGRLALRTRAALDLYYAALEGQDQAGFDKAAELLQEFERGYEPHVAALRTEAALRFEDLEVARESAARLRDAAERCENEWALQVAAEFDKVIEQRSATAIAPDRV